MVRVLRITGLLLIALGSSAFIWLFYIQLHYYAVMPRAADPTTGRIYAYTANRFQVYVTREEAKRGRLAEKLGPFGILAAMVGTYLLHQAKERQR